MKSAKFCLQRGKSCIPNTYMWRDINKNLYTVSPMEVVYRLFLLITIHKKDFFHSIMGLELVNSLKPNNHQQKRINSIVLNHFSSTGNDP